MKISIRDGVGVLISIAISQLAGIVGAVFTASAIPNWYAQLEQPSFSPPNWLFSPVWLALYTLMGVAAYLVYKQGWQRLEVKRALGVFAVQLVLNAAWSLIFFGLKDPALAFIEIVVMWVAIVLTIWAFAKVSRTAAWLLVPYLLWVSFASVLNFSIWQLNG